MTKNRREQGGLPIWLAGLGAVAGVVGGWIAYSSRAIPHEVFLPEAVNAPRNRFLGTRSSRFMSYYADTSAQGRPLVLIHSINAAASAYEMRPLFEQYQGKRPVYALELPGFGFSERSDRRYSPQIYSDAIIDFLTDVVQEAADVVALSLSSEFAARAALAEPLLFHSLAMISPSGFTTREEKPSSQQASDSQTSSLVYSVLANPLWSQAFYDLLATRVSIRYYLQKSFEGKVDDGLLYYDYATSHQPGARYAPLYFVSGQLFTPDIREAVYQRLTLPVLVLYDRDPFVSFDTLPSLVVQHSNWQATRITPTRGLPQFEQLEKTTEALDTFWGKIED